MSIDLLKDAPFAPQGSHEEAVAGRLSGVFGDRHPDGSPCCEATYVDGVKEGPGRMFYRSGRVYAVETWKAGQLEGPTTLFYETGALQAELNYRDGQLDGLCKEYFEGGPIAAETTWAAGRREGPSVTYDATGKVVDRGTAG